MKVLQSPATKNSNSNRKEQKIDVTGQTAQANEKLRELHVVQEAIKNANRMLDVPTAKLR
jgi:hypothetical protein